MKFDPGTRRLYTDGGELLKELHCPKAKLWKELRRCKDGIHRFCDACETRVLETSALSEAQIKDILQRDPDACLKVSTAQTNISLLQRRRSPDACG